MTAYIRVLEKKASTISASSVNKFLSKWALVIFVLWAMFLSFEYYGYGPNSYVVIHDNADVTLAIKLARAHEGVWITNGLWDTHQLGGTDVLTEVGAFDYTNTLFHVLPGWLAYAALMFLQRFVAGYFTYKLMTRHLGVRPPVAIVSGFLYALFFQPQINLQFHGFTSYDSLGLPGVPAVLYFLGNLASKENQRPGSVFLFSVGLGLAYAGVSFFAYTVFFFPLLFLFLVLFLPGKQKWFVLAGVFVGWFAVDFFEMAAAFNWSGFSQRTVRSYCPENGFGWDHWSGVLRSNLFNTNNWFPLLIASMAVFFSHKSGRSYRYAVIAFILAAAFLLSGEVFTFLGCSSINPIDLLRGFNLSRFYLYFPFLATVAGGAGLNSLMDWSKASSQRNASTLRWVAFGLLAVLFLTSVFDAARVNRQMAAERVAGSNYTNFFENPYLESIAKYVQETDPQARSVILIDNSQESSIFAHPGFMWPYGIHTLDGYANLYTLAFRDFWRTVIDPMMQTYPHCRYGLRLGFGETRLYLNNGCEVDEPVNMSSPANLFNFDLLQLAGVRYVITEFEIDGLSAVPEISEAHCPPTSPNCTHYYLYETDAPLPIISTRSKIKVLYSEEKIVNQLGQMGFNALATTAIVDGNQVPDLPVATLGPSPASLSIVSDSGDQRAVDFFSEDAKVVVLTQTFTQDWKAFIDGEPARLFSVYRAWTGIYIPAGQHEIELIYAPKYSINYIKYWFQINWAK